MLTAPLEISMFSCHPHLPEKVIQLNYCHSLLCAKKYWNTAYSLPQYRNLCSSTTTVLLCTKSPGQTILGISIGCRSNQRFTSINLRVLSFTGNRSYSILNGVQIFLRLITTSFVQHKRVLEILHMEEASCSMHPDDLHRSLRILHSFNPSRLPQSISVQSCTYGIRLLWWFRLINCIFSKSELSLMIDYKTISLTSTLIL